MPSSAPVMLAILDGWGASGESAHNAIAAARTPVWDALLARYPHGLLQASEGAVGLPPGQMGNSEVGHMNIGAGRAVMQDLPRIDAGIADGSMASAPALLAFIDKLKSGGGACHLMGLLSPGGVHSHQRHIACLAKLLAAAGIQVRLHLFLDGRDTPPRSAQEYLKEFERDAGFAGGIAVATVCGRYYAMDRDKRWERVRKAYDAMTEARGNKAQSAAAAVAAAYAAGVSDEFILPAAIAGYPGMRDGDGLLMANFRADRVREILGALLDPEFGGFARPRRVRFAAALGMAEYSERLARFMPALFPPQPLTDILGEVVARAGRTQLRAAETEKYAHVTFFFNGGREEPFPGEDRILIPSPQVATYDLKPEMSAPELTYALVDAVKSGKYDLIVCNYANTDMVGHTGDFAAAVKAVEAVDACLGRLQEAMERAGGALVVTADHGNAERMRDGESGQPHTAHTINPVPVVLVSPAWRGRPARLRAGALADIAPTVLRLMGIAKPAEMTGTSLLPDDDGGH